MSQLSVSYALSLAIGAVMSLPRDFGGLVLRARPSPLSQQLNDQFCTLYGTATRIHSGMDAAALNGGIDPISSLLAGSMVYQKGALADAKWCNISMAERLPDWIATCLTQKIDCKTAPPMVFWDQGIEDEQVHTSVAERCAFRIDLNDLSCRDLDPIVALDANPLAVSGVTATDDQIQCLVEISVRGGIHSLRAPIQALGFCKFLACVDGRNKISEQDIEIAMQMVLAHRFTQIPQSDTSPPPPPDLSQEDQVSNGGEDQNASQEMPPMSDILIDAIAANLPPFLLAPENKKSHASMTHSGGAGRRKKANTNGRPKASVSGRPAMGQRVDIVATLTAAAPWQAMRRKSRPDHPAAFIILPQDMRIKRYEQRSERLIIFGVDASGSAALARLAEAKGAIEIMLSEAYSNRDFVALVGFRGDKAQILLPPTRSLTMAKKSLAGFAGGGGTPLASGLECALDLATRSLRQGRTPTLAILTDGKANITLSGDPDRIIAAQDAEAQAKLARHLNINALFIDVGRRPNADLGALSDKMGARYVPLPRADARSVSSIVAQTLTS